MNTQFILVAIGLILFFIVWRYAVNIGGNILVFLVGTKFNLRHVQLILVVFAIVILIVGFGALA